MVSIIIPAYNSEKTIEKCVRSILAQRFQNWELLIVDDGSQDKTGAICDALGAEDARIQVFHKENGGVVLARAYGLERASGEYVAFVDSDDTVQPDMLEKLIGTALEQEADIVSCGYRELCEDGAGADRIPVRLGRLNEKQFFELLFESGTLGFLWNKLYRRELLDVSVPVGMTVCEDLYLNCMLLKQPRKVFVLPDCLYNYYTNPQSVTHSIEKKIDGEGRWKYLEAYKKILEAVSGVPEYRSRVLDAIPWIIKLGMEELREAGGKTRASALLRKEMKAFFLPCLRTGNTLRFKLGYAKCLLLECINARNSQ